MVSDPFGDPEYLGSTTPIDFGCTTSVALNVDGTKLMASYGCLGETLVMDTAALVATGKARSPSERERLPLDLTGSPANPSVNPGVPALRRSLPADWYKAFRLRRATSST